MLKSDEKNICPLCNTPLPFGVSELVIHTETFQNKKDVFTRNHEIVKITGFKCLEKNKTHDYICVPVSSKNNQKKTFPAYEKNLRKYFPPDEILKNMVNEISK